jgi:methylenetetrahydrofolate reductase (NADPH)
MPRAQVSFEIFPPQNPEASARLWEAVSALSPLSPDFISVTYGAGGGPFHPASRRF